MGQWTTGYQSVGYFQLHGCRGLARYLIVIVYSELWQSVFGLDFWNTKRVFC